MLAVKIAQQVEGPVKVVWSREEDIQHDMYRPYYYDRCRRGSMPTASRSRGPTASPAPRSSRATSPPLFKDGVDLDAVEGAAEPPYALPNIHVDYVRVEPPASRPPSGAASASTHNVFVVESFIDELAAAAKQDPVAYRKALLGHNPRALGVLTLAAEKAGWGSRCRRPGRGVSRAVRLRQLPRPGRRGRGRDRRRR